MRLLKIICLCLFASFVFGQGKLSPEAKKKLKAQRIYAAKYNSGEFNVYKIDSIPKDGVLIYRGWKVKFEDKLDFSISNFDDSKWDTTSTDKPFYEFSKIAKNRIGWFRKKVFIDSSLIGKPYIFNVLITGAAEIFLNGKLIHEIGKVSLDPKKAKTKYFKIRLPYSFTFSTPGVQTLAVRFLFTPQRKLDQYQDKFFPFSIRILKLEGFVEKILIKETTNTLATGICAGLFFMMAFIHFFFHQYFRSKKYNRSISISMILFGVYLCLLRGSYVYDNFQIFANIGAIRSILQITAHIILLNAIYEFLLYPKKVLFWVVITTFILLNILAFFQKIPSYFVGVAYGLLILNYVFLIWKSIKNKTPSGIVMRSAVIILVGIFVAFLIGLGIYFAVFNPNSSNNEQGSINSIMIPIFMILLLVGPQLSVSGAISFSLAKEFVKTNISLSQKLEEIEKLSEEKQHILSTQNEYLEKQVTQRTAELNQSLENLKITQNQLIQSEKLASLGELTAGIAHEIQNPLNFVNNFSELSVELIEELKEERQKEKGGRDEELENELLADISQNLEKITHHGKRASSIVKGMLEHSRSSSNVKELTDINALADEYLRLSYHGLRAKDKTFNANLKTDFDETIEKVNIVSQDIGRVILNLITNAFYAVNEKKKSNSDDYEPTVSVSSKKVNDKIELKIKDNGNGIPEKVLDKIFQPFFTTKPTGQGTGLGLSLSYDIVKAHGGELKVETKEGEFTEFNIILPQKTA